MSTGVKKRHEDHIELSERVLLTLREYARVTGQSPISVKNRADRGQLPLPTVQLHPRGQRYVRVADLSRLLDDLVAQQTASRTPREGVEGGA